MFVSSDELTGRFTFDAEGHLDPKDPWYIGKLSHPSDDSGVTIGAGYDMGGRTEASVKQDLMSAGMAASVAAQFAKGAGLTGDDADEFVDANRAKLVADLDPLRKLFTQIYPGYVQTAQSYYNYHAMTFAVAMPSYGTKYASAVFFDWKSLYPAIRVMAADFVFQGFGQETPGYGRPLHFCMTNNFDWLIEYIQKTRGMQKYEKGRGRAAYLQSKKIAETTLLSKCIPQTVFVGDT